MIFHLHMNIKLVRSVTDLAVFYSWAKESLLLFYIVVSRGLSSGYLVGIPPRRLIVSISFVHADSPPSNFCAAGFIEVVFRYSSLWFSKPSYSVLG